jgi:hypothetical protein
MALAIVTGSLAVRLCEATDSMERDSAALSSTDL